MKDKDCKENQIFNTKTNRCINKDSKKAIEYLFNIGDKTIHKLYELVDGKIVKRCDKDKIRNLKTKRCIKVNSLDKKIEAIEKIKKALIPFKNRVSADIYHRNKYLILMRRELKKYNKDNKGCLRVYKKIPNGFLYSYRIGNRIILKERIGSDSIFGLVYLSEFREKTKKLFTFTSKIYGYVKDTNIELEILTKLTNLVRMDMCPHFPIFYGYVICDNMNKFDKDSFIKSKEDDKSVSQDISKFPILIKQKKDSKIITTFNELANGDLWNFFKLYKSNKIYLINAFIQQLLSIMFFNYHTGRIHNDTHPGNFLYHNIKAGGFFHYNIFGVDYYLENIGFLWVIWDFDLSIKATNIVKSKKTMVVKNDYENIIKEYNDADVILNDLISKFYYFKKPLNKKSLNEYINILPKKLSNTYDNILLNKLPLGAKIINKTPYKINKGNVFK
jgi:hypothetical protein